MISNVLATAINAVLPIVLMTALGYILHHKGMLSDRFLQQGNTLVFRLGLPVMLFVNVYNIDSIFDIRWDIALYSMAALLVVFLLGYVVALISTPVLKRRGVVLQCIFYSNFAIIGLTLAVRWCGGGSFHVGAICGEYSADQYIGRPFSVHLA